MTTENRINGWVTSYIKSHDSSNQHQEPRPRGYFKQVLKEVKGHAKYLENKGVSPQILAVALQEFVLKYASDCTMRISDNPPNTVILSYGESEAIVYGDEAEEVSSEFRQLLDSLAVHGLIVLLQIEEYGQKVSSASNKVREIFISKERKCVERVRQYANVACWTSSFEELVAEIKKKIAVDCPDATVETNKLKDIFVVFGDRKYRVFINDTYEYPDELFPLNQSFREEAQQEKLTDPNFPWD